MESLTHLATTFIVLFTITICFMGCSKDYEPDITRSTLTYNTNGASSGTTPTAITEASNIKITVGSTVFNATLYNNEAVTAFKAMLPLTINMGELGGVEKYYYLPFGTTLPTKASIPRTTQNGDLMLYGNNCLVLFYTTFSTSYSYTPIGKVDYPTRLAAALGSGNVTVKYELD